MPKLKSEQTSVVISDFRGPHAFMSNFYRVEVIYEGMSYPSSEHAYQAAKTTNILTRMRIGLLAAPEEAKQSGRRLVLRKDWEEVKLEVMLTILRAKFSLGSRLASDLLETGDAMLIEGNRWHDQTWGNCTCGRPECQPAGENWLGKLLMQVRRELRCRPSES